MIRVLSGIKSDQQAFGCAYLSDFFFSPLAMPRLLAWGCFFTIGHDKLAQYMHTYFQV